MESEKHRRILGKQGKPRERLNRLLRQSLESKLLDDRREDHQIFGHHEVAADAGANAATEREKRVFRQALTKYACPALGLESVRILEKTGRPVNRTSGHDNLAALRDVVSADLAVLESRATDAIYRWIKPQGFVDDLFHPTETSDRFCPGSAVAQRALHLVV